MMDRHPHRPSCARRLRQEALSRGDSVHELARAIRAHCSVSSLRAHRLARGLTLKQAADALNARAASRADAPRVDGDQLGHWETGRRPRPVTLGLLCEIYDCSPQDLGLAAPATTVIDQVRSAPDVREDDGLGSLELQVDFFRRAVDRTLAAGTVTATQLDHLDEQVLWDRERYVYTPPRPMMGSLLGHLAEVRELAAHRQPAAVQVRLSELTAVLATLIADVLMKLGHLTRSRSWYATARNAADDSGSTELRARVRAQAAMLPYHYGPLEAAVALAREARVLCRNRPSPTAAFAWAAEARALAKLGDSEGAQRALARAAAAFEQSRTGSTSEQDAFAFPERRFRLYESGTQTALGRTSRARRVQEAGLRLYPANTGIDPALLTFEAALCLAHDHSAAEACQLAGATLLGLAPEHRTSIVVERARDVVGALPARVRGSRAVRELREIIALPPTQV
ncbi:helix-turn-helix domain-containing protein [Streptomyces sp. NPDC055992]|uniref:helix-turn-helix domain-containing protein n=1 Tax=Streptomyces sp. NPDC055992 TaxID=3345673 RepID=UPI0035D990AC